MGKPPVFVVVIPAILPFFHKELSYRRFEGSLWDAELDVYNLFCTCFFCGLVRCLVTCHSDVGFDPVQGNRRLLMSSIKLFFGLNFWRAFSELMLSAKRWQLAFSL
ncbi:hypothetical protein AVEN_149208-1 [Araneus ventricosus]|uniref:Uncharacterized protein n=1 Tax=Araneus ventricosus TaxID=182803 RepID=A0A4Y2IMD8_ARAVE|nr:hypothetical protein AVEN_149208-1 [Araneus ventricosus]